MSLRVVAGILVERAEWVVRLSSVQEGKEGFDFGGCYGKRCCMVVVDRARGVIDQLAGTGPLTQVWDPNPRFNSGSPQTGSVNNIKHSYLGR